MNVYRLDKGTKMDRTKLKAYAPAARRDFIQAMKARAALFGITEKGIAPAITQGDVTIIQGQAYPKAVEGRRQRLVGRIEREGFEQVMEAMAYTWFNRFAALRYMELQGYLDHGYRVLSHPEGKPVPEILEQAEHLDLPGIKASDVVDLKLEGKEQELYRRLLVAQCNALHRVMPFLFEAIEDETELLLPDNLLHSDSVLRKVVDNLASEDCENVEVLGWLYQFYIAEKKDAVMARKSVVPTEDIPAVTQLFTPHWIVRYLVENSLGRLWLLNRPSSRLREYMPYYIEGEVETDFLRINKPEEIRLLDPACGSGHMLLYAFDLLVLIYEEAGYAPNDIPTLILRYNLHGLEICPRAAQLAGLALVLKAREKSRRFLQPERIVQPAVMELQNVLFDEGELREYIRALGLGDLFSEAPIRLLHQFEEAKTFGSLIQPCMDEKAIAEVRRAINSQNIGSQIFLRDTHLKVLRVLEQAEALTQRYHVVVANPPYMGSGAMIPSIRNFLGSTLAEGKSDLYGAFILRNFAFLTADGLCGMITIPNWLFLQSFSDLRRIVLNVGCIVSMSHNGRGVWGGDFGSCGFVLAKTPNTERKGVFRRLFNKAGEIQSNTDIEANFHNLDAFPSYLRSSSDFKKLPGYLVAYWLSKQSLKLLSGPTIENLGDAKRGLQPGDVERLVKKWWEVGSDNFELDAQSRNQAVSSSKRWFKFDSGGAFRRWYGNNILVVDWEGNGRRIKSGHNPIVPSEHLYFEPGFVWSRITASVPSLRLHDAGVINGDVSPCFFPNEFRLGVLGLLNGSSGNSGEG